MKTGKCIRFSMKRISTHHTVMATATTLINEDGTCVRMWENFLTDAEADELYEELIAQPHWDYDMVPTKGGIKRAPRRTMGLGTGPHRYGYTGVVKKALPLTPILRSVLAKVEDALAVKFEFAFCNLYETGADYIGWHADKIKGQESIIASLSLGGCRDFVLRHKKKYADARLITNGTSKKRAMDACKVTVPLTSGSLLTMEGMCQHHWEHTVPKRSGTRGICVPRINITFRQLRTLR